VEHSAAAMIEKSQADEIISSLSLKAITFHDLFEYNTFKNIEKEEFRPALSGQPY